MPSLDEQVKTDEVATPVPAPTAKQEGQAPIVGVPVAEKDDVAALEESRHAEEPSKPRSVKEVVPAMSMAPSSGEKTPGTDSTVGTETGLEIVPSSSTPIAAASETATAEQKEEASVKH